MFSLGKKIAVKAVVISIVWAFRKLKKPKNREKALHFIVKNLYKHRKIYINSIYKTLLFLPILQLRLDCAAPYTVQEESSDSDNTMEERRGLVASSTTSG